MLAHRDTHLTAPAPASVALVCDAGPQVGIGHVMRCLALAEELLARGSDVTLVADLAELGILVAPGAFYGSAGTGHVRVALTASDERVGDASTRLTGA